MKSFLILLSEKQPHLLNEKLLEDHILYLQKLKKNGYLSICGPFSDNQSAMFVLKSDSEQHASKLIEQDPFIQKHYYKKFVIHEFNEASETNNWLTSSKQTTDNLTQKNNIERFLNRDVDDSKAPQQPVLVSLLFRKLKEGKTYNDFRNAWLPPVDDIKNYFDMPVVVINAQNMQDKTEMISVGLIWAPLEEAIEKYEHYQETESMRHEKIEQVTDQSVENRFCKILDIDILGS